MSEQAMLEAAAGVVSRETWEALQLYVARLREWNQRINLVSAGDMANVWQRHIADCAQLHPLARADTRWLDFGSGAGLPGLVIAILRREESGWMHMVESNGKKCAFLAAVISELALRATVHHQRIEKISSQNIRDIEVVSARAVAALPRLLDLAEPWLAAGAHALFQKGRDFSAELDLCRDHWQFDLVQHRSRIDRDSVILELSRVRRTETS